MAMKLNMLPPSVNNMSVRVFVRAAGIPVEEENVWGQTQGDEYLSKYPPGLTPTIADDRLAATLEFLAATDTGIPGWAKEYIGRVESALGDAYSEPAGDVRGYVAQATGEAVAAS